MSRSFKKKYKLSGLDRRILNRLQDDIPFEERPWELMAEELAVKEDYLLRRIAFFKKKGIIRRISAVFSPGRINFASTLVGAKISPDNIAGAIKKINSYPEVTHNYRREGEYSVWFTLVAGSRGRIARIMRGLRKNKAIEKLSEFPTVKLFKINVKFSV